MGFRDLGTVLDGAELWIKCGSVLPGVPREIPGLAGQELNGNGSCVRAGKVSGASSWGDNPEWLRDSANIWRLEVSDKENFGESFVPTMA